MGVILEVERINKIDGTSKSIRQLLSGVKYSIDYYQREYKWETRHVTELMDDLEAKFTAAYSEDHDRTKVQGYPNYFLGSIVISKKKGRNYIIDGQQRLTSITLLLIYLNNLQEDSRHSVNVDSLIFSERYGRKSFNIEAEERVRCMEALYGRQRTDLLDSRSESVRNIVERYDDIETFFPDSLRGRALPFFIDWLIDNVAIVEVVTYNDDDAYTIFETMNDRGLSLSPTDMLKGYLLANIDDPEMKARANRLWKRRILELSELGKDEAHDFFKAWLRSKYAETIRERKKGASAGDFDRIGAGFHKWVRDEKEKMGLTSTESFADFVLNKFDLFSRIYLNLRKASLSFDPKFEYVYYNGHNNFTLQDHLILASINYEDSDEVMNEKIRLVSGFIDMFVVRRFLNYRTLGYSSIQYTVFNLMKEFRSLNTTKLRVTLKEKIAEMEETLEGVKTFYLHSQNKTYVRHLLARMTFFVERESGMETSFAKYVSKEVDKPFEIEHVWADRYDYHQDEFSTPQEFEDYRNRVGGLILLPEDFNKSYGDAPYDKKLQHYYSHNLLARSLNERCYHNNPTFSRFIELTGLPFRPHDDFKKGDLDLRQELYFRICELIWNDKRFEP